MTYSCGWRPSSLLKDFVTPSSDLSLSSILPTLLNVSLNCTKKYEYKLKVSSTWDGICLKLNIHMATTWAESLFKINFVLSIQIDISEFIAFFQLLTHNLYSVQTKTSSLLKCIYFCLYLYLSDNATFNVSEM